MSELTDERLREIAEAKWLSALRPPLAVQDIPTLAAECLEHRRAREEVAAELRREACLYRVASASREADALRIRALADRLDPKEGA